MLGKEREDQIDRELGTEIGQYQRSEERVGDPVQLSERNEQERRQTENRRHGKVRHIAGELGTLEFCGGHRGLLWDLICIAYIIPNPVRNVKDGRMDFCFSDGIDGIYVWMLKNFLYAGIRSIVA